MWAQVVSRTDIPLKSFRAPQFTDQRFFGGRGESGHYISSNLMVLISLLEFGVRDTAILVVLQLVRRPFPSCFQTFRTMASFLFGKLMGLAQIELEALEEFP